MNCRTILMYDPRTNIEIEISSYADRNLRETFSYIAREKKRRSEREVVSTPDKQKNKRKRRKEDQWTNILARETLKKRHRRKTYKNSKRR